MKSILLTCDYCNNQYNRRLVEHKRNLLRGCKRCFCSVECMMTWRNTHKAIIILECVKCKNSFKADSKDRRFCSRKCATAHTNSVTDRKVIRGRRIPEKSREEKRLIRWNQCLKNKYKITPEDYKNMKIAQGYCCGICKRSETELKKSLYIDHDHKTGKTRGLLCPLCNFMLGCAKDTKEILVAGMNYLTKYE